MPAQWVPNRDGQSVHIVAVPCKVSPADSSEPDRRLKAAPQACRTYGRCT
jgi:hypothetical protein